MALHAGVIGLLVLLTWLGGRHKPSLPAHVFTLVSPPTSSSAHLKKARVNAASSQLKVVSYADFVQRHGKPASPIPSASMPGDLIAPPRIETEAVLRELENFVALGAAESAELSADVANGYVRVLREKIRSRWIQPEALQDSDVATEVTFTVAASGRVTGFRIVRGSGVEAFDASVRKAFTLLSVVPPPDGKAHVFRLTLRMREQ